MVCETPRSTAGLRARLRGLLALFLAVRASCSSLGGNGVAAISDAAFASSLAAEEELAADPLADEVLCPISLIQTTLRQVRLRDGVEEELEAAWPPPAVARGAPEAGAADAAEGGEEAAHLPRSFRFATLPVGMRNELMRAEMDAHGPSLVALADSTEGGHDAAIGPAAAEELGASAQPHAGGESVSSPQLAELLEAGSRDSSNHIVASRGAGIAQWGSELSPDSASAEGDGAEPRPLLLQLGAEDSLAGAADANATPSATPVASVAAKRQGGVAAGRVGIEALAASKDATTKHNAKSHVRGWRRRVRFAERRDARLVVMLCALVLLLAITTITTVRSLCIGMRRQREGGARERAVKAIPRCDFREVQRHLAPTGAIGSSYHGSPTRPIRAGQPVRLQARVLGPLDGNATLVAPLTQRPCVLYEASVSRPAGAEGRHGPELLARCTRSVDFVVVLEDAPEVRVELRGEEVSLFGMSGGLCAERWQVMGAPKHWPDFVAAHSLPGVEEASLQEVLDFREVALLVDSAVTLIGDLHYGVTGTLSLWPWHGEAGELKPREPQEAEAEATTSEAWRTSWERSVCRSAEEADEDEELHFGAVLVSDDPDLLDDPGRAGCGFWRRCFGQRAGKSLAASTSGRLLGMSTPKSGG